jgi:hypothetical protein
MRKLILSAVMTLVVMAITILPALADTIGPTP